MLPQRLTLPQTQQQWAAELDPILKNPILKGQQLNGISLINGTTLVNHGLQRKLIGWFLVGIDANAAIHDNQVSNQTPQLTLSLTSNANCIVNLWVY